MGKPKMTPGRRKAMQRIYDQQVNDAQGKQPKKVVKPEPEPAKKVNPFVKKKP